MPTSISPLTAENMIKANSGAYYLLHQDGGYTGNLNLTGPARIDNLNAGNAYVAATLNVTGNQANFGNTTGFNFNHLARIVNTGDAYLRSVTGVATFNEINATGRTKIDQIYDGLNISGDLGLVGDARMTGAVNITGTLFVNGVQITGVNQASQELVLTGSYASIYANKGDILVGTGGSGVGILSTGANGYLLMVDNTSDKGYSFLNPGNVGGVNYLTQSSGIFGTTRTIVVRPTGGANGISLNFDTLGTGSYIFGPTGFNTISNVRNGFLFGSGNSINGVGSTTDFLPIAMGQGNSVTANNGIAIGKDNTAQNNGGDPGSVAVGTHNYSENRGFSIGTDAYSYGETSLAIGGGGFSSARGSSQTNVFTFKGETNNAATTIGTIPSNFGSLGYSALTFTVLVSAISAGGVNAAGYKFEGVAKNGTYLTAPTKTVLFEDVAGWNADIGSGLDIQGTSTGGEDVRWSATCLVNQVMSG